MNKTLLEWIWNFDCVNLEISDYNQSFIDYNRLVSQYRFDKVLLDVQAFEQIINQEIIFWIRDNYFKNVHFNQVKSIALVRSRNVLAQQAIKHIILPQIPKHIDVELFTDRQMAREWFEFFT